MTLYDEGRFQVDDPVAKYLPEFAKVKVYDGEEAGAIKLASLVRPITIRDLMCHTAGLAYGLMSGIPRLMKCTKRPRSSIARRSSTT